MPRSSPSINCAARMENVSHIRRRVVTVMGLPASICCQCRAEKTKSDHVFLSEPLGLAQPSDALSQGGKRIVCHRPSLSFRRFWDATTTSRLAGPSTSSTAALKRGVISLSVKGRGSPRTSCDSGTSKAIVIRRSVFHRDGRPFSICCQCRQRIQNQSCLPAYSAGSFLIERTRLPNASKNLLASNTCTH